MNRKKSKKKNSKVKGIAPKTKPRKVDVHMKDPFKSKWSNIKTVYTRPR